MGCACKGRTKSKFLWYSPSGGVEPRVYNSEIEAKAKVHRNPGSTYIPYNPNLAVDAQIAAAEAAKVE